MWPPTPPITPPTASVTLHDLPTELLGRIVACSQLDSIDRLRLQLTSRRVKAAVDRAYTRISHLRIANTESEDDRLS